MVAKAGNPPKAVIVTIPPALQASLLHRTKPPFPLTVTLVEEAVAGEAVA